MESLTKLICFPHSVPVSEFFYHSDFMWNKTYKNQYLIKIAKITLSDSLFRLADIDFTQNLNIRKIL